MHIRKSPGKIVFDLLNTGLLLLLSFLFLAPVLHVLFSSVSDPAQWARVDGIVLYPRGFDLRAYELAFQNRNILSGYGNTLIYVAGTLVFGMLLTVLGAYVCSRRTFYFRKAVMRLMTVTLFFSGGLIPFYLVVRGLGMYNSWTAIVLPSALSVWNIIIVRTAFLNMPQSLEEAAKIDGANDFYILFMLFVPLSKAVLAVIALYYAVGQWNSWFNAMIFLQDRYKYPLQLIMREVLVLDDTTKFLLTDAKNEMYKPLVKLATIMISVVPIFCLYPFLQKYFVTGVLIGSIKG